MSLRFLHTADWQIGKAFRSFGTQADALREARLEAISAIGGLAADEGIRHVLVAGDVYDTEAPNRRTLLAPLERMRAFERVTWHLLPGNHDPHRPGGLWERLAGDLPENVAPRLTAEPVDLGEAVLLPSPLFGKATANDPTAWMDAAPSAAGKSRIGLAHGSVSGFGSEKDAANLIDPRRPDRAGLAYLALGDWHRTMKVNDRIWYAGTPEPDRHDSQETGTVLQVECGGGGTAPAVTAHEVGRFRWRTDEIQLHSRQDVELAEGRLRSGDEMGRRVQRLIVSGALSLTDQPELTRMLERLDAAVRWLDVDRGALEVRPTQSDLDNADLDGILRTVADRLKDRLDTAADDDARVTAEDALVELYVQAGPGGGGAS